MARQQTIFDTPFATRLEAWSPLRWGRSLSLLAPRLSRAPASTVPPFWSWSTVLMLLLIVGAIVVLRPYDAEASRYFQGLLSPFMTVWRASSDLGLTRPHQIVSFIIAAYMGGCDWRLAAGRQYPLIKLAYSQSLFYFSAITLSDILANLGKFVVGRARPKFLDELGAYHLKPFSIGHDFASFPSGHSATFGSLALILVVWFPRWRFVSVPVLFLFACSRVPIGAHFPTDVLAGFTLGFLASLWLARFLARRRLAFRFETNRMIPVVCYKE